MAQNGVSPDAATPVKHLSGLRATLRRLDNLSIRIKASAAAAVLLVCLLALGANAYLTSTRSAAGLRTLSQELVSKQQAFSEVTSAVVATHMKIFRYVSWASNGVSSTVLNRLYAQIEGDLGKLSYRIDALARRPDLSHQERQSLQRLLAKWNDARGKAKDTIGVGRTDAAMATMMLSETDDSFEAVGSELADMSRAVTAGANHLSNSLYQDAQRTKLVIVIGTVVGFLVSALIAAAAGRSIVTPIRSITDVMQRLSAGETEVEIGHRDRHDEIGTMADAIDVFRRTIIERQAMEQRLTDAIEAISEGFCLYDIEDRLVVCNSRYKEMFSYADDRVAPGMPFSQIVRWSVEHGLIEDAKLDGPAWLARRIALHRRSAEPQIQRRSDGRWLRVSERLTTDGGVVATYTDITELKQRESELGDLVHQLEAARDTAEATLATLRATQQQLVVQQKMAALGQLTAGIAHEIKNPLNFVNNFAGLSVELLEELKGETEPVIATLDAGRRAEIDETMTMLTQNLEKIAEHGRRADGIVRSMLLHSRGGSTDRQIVDLNALVEEALDLAYHGARARDQNFNITMERNFERDLKPIEIVPQDLTRVFLNLIGNGFYAATTKSRESGHDFRPVLTVTTRERGEAVEVRVRDNGAGIPAEFREKLFQPFFTTKPTGEGTGLGLSISHEIVTQQHGGTITVESEVGGYTEFTVRLPRIRTKGVQEIRP